MADVVTLKVGGQAFEGWTSQSVQKGIRNPAGAFSLDFAERIRAEAAPMAIRRGDACEVLIGGEVVITGWVDKSSPGFDAGMRTLSVSGRDKAGDLVDCAALNKPGVWRGRSLTQIAQDLVAPFGLTVTARTDVGPAFPQFALQQGETAWSALERLARFRGLLAAPTSTGNIELIQPGRRRASFALVQGENLLGGGAVHDDADRFSLYVLKGQSAGNDEVNGQAASGPSAEVTDSGVRRYRPTLIVAEDQATLASLRARAGWEASVRAASASAVTLDVQGWRDPTGAIWSADLVVPVRAPWLDVDGDLLIADVEFKLDAAGGSLTRLTCAPPDAYRPQPPAAGAKP